MTLKRRPRQLGQRLGRVLGSIQKVWVHDKARGVRLPFGGTQIAIRARHSPYLTASFPNRRDGPLRQGTVAIVQNRSAE